MIFFGIFVPVLPIIIKYTEYCRDKKMEKSSTLSQKQLQQFLWEYLSTQHPLQQILTKNFPQKSSNITPLTILSLLSPKLRQMCLQLQHSLFTFRKIKSLKLYDHDTPYLFSSLTQHLRLIVPVQARSDFMQLYRNTGLIGVDVVWQRTYVFVGSQKKAEIYGAILAWCEREGLFGTAVKKQMEIMEEGMPFQVPEKVFPKRDLQLIYKKCKECSFDPLQTYKSLLAIPLLTPQYKTPKQFTLRLDNLLLIGAYTLHKQSCLLEQIAPDSWPIFRRRSFHRVSFDAHLETLLRVSVRGDPTYVEVCSVRPVMSNRWFRRTPKCASLLVKAKGKGDDGGAVGKIAERILGCFQVGRIGIKYVGNQGHP